MTMRNYNGSNIDDLNEEEIACNKVLLRLEEELGRGPLCAILFEEMIEVAIEEADDFDNNYDMDPNEKDEWSETDHEDWDEHVRDVLFDTRSNTDSAAFDALYGYLTEEELDLVTGWLGDAARNYYYAHWSE